MATALYWSGGKDCTLAFLESLRAGIHFDFFVTFIGEDTEFRCHPMNIMKEQSRQCGIPHLFYIIREPYMPSFKEAIHCLKKDHKINCVVTGDLIEKESDRFEQYWLRKFCLKEKVELLCPMGNMDRLSVLHKIFHNNLDVRFTGVHCDHLPVALLWKKFSMNEVHLMRMKKEILPDFDIAGENGEYHTSVIACDMFEISVPDLSHKIETFYEVAYLPLLAKFSPLQTSTTPNQQKEKHYGSRRLISSAIKTELAQVP